MVNNAGDDSCDGDDSSGNNSNVPPQRASFHGHTEHSLAADETIVSLTATIDSLQTSLVDQATSSAETLNDLNTLRAAHEALLAEHGALQGQMDDAVELLKYLKDEKLQHEDHIQRLTHDLQQQQGSVVSLTIETLTKDKMDLATQLDKAKDKIAQLDKLQQAYELQAGQTLNQADKLAKLEKDAAAKDAQINALNDQLEQVAAVQEEMDRLRADLAAKTQQATEQQNNIQQLNQQISNLDTQHTSTTQHTNQQEEQIQQLLHQVHNLQTELAAKNTQLSSIDQELIREKAEMQSHLDNLHQQLLHYQEEEEERHHINTATTATPDDNHPQQHTSQHPSQPSTENPSQTQQQQHLTTQNELLHLQIQQLESQLQSESEKRVHEAEIHAQLEREMQDRLAQRLAAHLQESEVAMEKRIREELEEEYNALIQSRQQQQQQQEEEEEQWQKQQQQQRQLRSKSFTTSEKQDTTFTSNHNNNTSEPSTAFVKELEDQLRQQLQQVKEERERWQTEQEEFQNRVLLSKQQLDKIREGYRAKYDKEKRRANDLQKASEEFQVVIEALVSGLICILFVLEWIGLNCLNDVLLS